MNRISKMLPIMTLVMVVVGFVPRANAVLLDFEGGTAGTAVGGFYAGLGATFSNGSFQDNFGLPGSGGAQGLGDITDPVSPPYNPAPSNPIIITFSSPVSAFSIVAIDVGGDGARVDAYDAYTGGSLLAFDQLIGSGGGVGNFGTLSVSAPNILRVELYQPLNVEGAADGILFDNANFTLAAPEPATLVLLGTGLVGLAVARRRKAA